MLCYAMLCYAILCCAVLCYAILYCILEGYEKGEERIWTIFATMIIFSCSSDGRKEERRKKAGQGTEGRERV
jgi:predicted membrane metal-binding protein